MITGFNTDIKYRGQVYHVQTEDKGMGNPVIESLVYKGGEILATRRHSYKEKLDEGCADSDLTKLMEDLHKKVIFEIQSGKMDLVKEPTMFDAPEDKGLDDLVIDYIAGAESQEKIKIKLPDQLEILPGVMSEFVVSTRKSITHEPVQGAKVAVNLIASGRAHPLFDGVADKLGKITARFLVPDSVGDEALLVISSSTPDGAHDECQQIIRRRPS